MVIPWLLLVVLCSSSPALADVGFFDVVSAFLDLGLSGGGGGKPYVAEVELDNSIVEGVGVSEEPVRSAPRSRGKPNCYSVETIGYNLQNEFDEQPLFVTFLTMTTSYTLIDNICYTFFPLPDDPYTFNIYRSTVFSDGSYRITTAVGTEISIGKSRIADPFCTFSANVIGFAGCDTYVVYRCMEFGDCAESNLVNIIGVSPNGVSMGLSCIQKVEEMASLAGLPPSPYVVLPMMLPNRCVMEQVCVNNIEGNFFRALNIDPPNPPAVL